MAAYTAVPSSIPVIVIQQICSLTTYVIERQKQAAAEAISQGFVVINVYDVRYKCSKHHLSAA